MSIDTRTIDDIRAEEALLREQVANLNEIIRKTNEELGAVRRESIALTQSNQQEISLLRGHLQEAKRLNGDAKADAASDLQEITALREALVELTPPMPSPITHCHIGICEQSECANCRRIAKAHAAIANKPVAVRFIEWQLRDLRRANITRQEEWCPEMKPDLSFRGNELAGEVGEACNVIKKLERERYGWRGSRSDTNALAEELADVVICCDLVALTAGIDLQAAVVTKFDATSANNGLEARLQ